MNKNQIEVINELLDDPEDLTSWEYDFVMSIAEQETLSVRQDETLKEISYRLNL